MFTSRTRARLAACATLAALGLAPAVHAQILTLNTGENVTVDGTGTHGIAGGKAFHNTTTSYTDIDDYYNFYSVRTTDNAAFTLGKGGSLTAGHNKSALAAYGSGPVTITGGSIVSGKHGGALDAEGSGPVTITGGSITGNVGTSNGPMTIKGGTFSTVSGDAMLYAGVSDDAKGSTIDLYGKFDGLTLGQTQTLPRGKGSFTGTLENNTVSQTFTYVNNTIIRLHDVALSPPPRSRRR